VTGSTDDRRTPRLREALGELGHLLLDGQDPQSVLQRIVDLVKQALSGAVEVSITLLRDEQATTAACTGELALRLDETQYAQGHGPCIEAALNGRVVEIPDGRTEQRWPEYVATFLDSGALSSIAVPVPAPHLVAGLNVYAFEVHAFSDEDRQVLVDFADHAGAALTNMDTLQDARDLAANLRRALESRSVIEQAKGILMERHKLTADRAFRVLADASMHRNVRLRDLAETLVLTGVLPD